MQRTESDVAKLPKWVRDKIHALMMDLDERTRERDVLMGDVAACQKPKADHPKLSINRMTSPEVLLPAGSRIKFYLPVELKPGVLIDHPTGIEIWQEKDDDGNWTLQANTLFGRISVDPVCANHITLRMKKL